MSWSVRMRSGGSRSSSSGSLLAYCFTHRKAPWRLMRCGASFRLWDVCERSSVRWGLLSAGTRNGTIPKRSMFSNHGRLPGTEAARSPHIHHPSSVTMVDCLVLKLMHPKTAHELGRCISKYRKICLVFLFQRAVSAIFSWKVRSPQALIPALTAVWAHYSRFQLRSFGS